jgi:hypothetical protein
MNILRKIFLISKNKIRIKLLMSKDTTGLLKIGDRIELYGGYNREHEYLKNPPAKSRTGQVINFIEKNKHLQAVVRLDYVITYEEFSSNIVILTLRYVNQTWRTNCRLPYNSVQSKLEFLLIIDLL